MKTTPAMLKHRKVAKNKEVKQNRGGARRKRTSPKSTLKRLLQKKLHINGIVVRMSKLKNWRVGIRQYRNYSHPNVSQ
jgi:hypothetical protein